MEKVNPVCGEQALELLNCVADPNYNQEKCLALLLSLRECVLSKKVKNFSLADHKKSEADSSTQKQS